MFYEDLPFEEGSQRPRPLHPPTEGDSGKVPPHRAAGHPALRVPQPWCQALRTGQEPPPSPRPPPHPVSFWNVDSGPRISNTPQSPTTLSRPCRVTSAAGHLVVITHQGRGLWWALPVRPRQALGGWSLSSEGAQLLPALISCGDFLTVLETPGCLRLWELHWLRKDGLYPPPRGWSHIPRNPQGTLCAESWTCVEWSRGGSGIPH